MTWGELAKALNAFMPTTSLQAFREAWCYTVENEAVGLTFQDFITWYWPGGERLIVGENCVMKKARTGSPVLPATEERARMLTAEMEAKLFLSKKSRLFSAGWLILKYAVQKSWSSRVQKG